MTIAVVDGCIGRADIHWNTPDPVCYTTQRCVRLLRWTDAVSWTR
jgi:hypothetical protein